MQVYGVYQTHTQYGYFAVMLTPIERVTMRLGYSMVNNQGNTTQFNSLLPLGPLSSTYQLPLASVDVNVYKNVSFKAGYNYYGYGEGSFVGPTAPPHLPRQQHHAGVTLRLLERHHNCWIRVEAPGFSPVKAVPLRFGLQPWPTGAHSLPLPTFLSHR